MIIAALAGGNTDSDTECASFCCPTYSSFMRGKNPTLSTPLFDGQDSRIHEGTLRRLPHTPPPVTIALSDIWQPREKVNSSIRLGQPEMEALSFVGTQRVQLSSGSRKKRGHRCCPTSRRSDSGMAADMDSADNERICSYAGCIDKRTGEPKRFKRPEHKRRHEKTVHEKRDNPQYECWVPTCKRAPFTRMDNLRGHLRKTHGKISAPGRHDYVATQDKNSEYFDPEWVGELEEHGTRRWYPKHGNHTFKCEARGCDAAAFTGADKLKAHMESTHGPELTICTGYDSDDDDWTMFMENSPIREGIMA